MSDSSIPAYVDTRKAFQQEGKISGELSLQRLPGFLDSLANEVGKVQVDLSFDLNESKQRIISGRLRAEVEVICQRCLEPVAISLADDIKLALVKDEAAAQALDADLDPWIFEDYRLDIAPLVEEQLILCMPLVNYHQGGACTDRKNYVAGQQETEGAARSGRAGSNPFSVLESLKKSGQTD